MTPPRSSRGARTTPQRDRAGERFRLDLDLRHELLTPSRLPFLRPLEGLLGERPVEDPASLLDLVGSMLHALKESGFGRVDHWEVEPGGWLPLPEASHPGPFEPIGHLRRALSTPEWKPFASAHRFSVRLTGGGGRRAEATVRRVHREREHGVTLELTDGWKRGEVHRLIHSIRRDLPVLRIHVLEMRGP